MALGVELLLERRQLPAVVEPKDGRPKWAHAQPRRGRGARAEIVAHTQLTPEARVGDHGAVHRAYLHALLCGCEDFNAVLHLKPASPRLGGKKDVGDPLLECLILVGGVL